MHRLRRLSPGLFPVYKPAGWTSNDVVRKIKGILISADPHSEVKLGHGGTLDPFATGVLVLAQGHFTKLLQSYLEGEKEYVTTARLGVATDTADRDGKAVEEKPYEHVTQDLIFKALPKFRGDILQVPPAYSAVKVDGKRLYSLARKGVTVEVPARPVTVKHFECLGLTLPEATFRIRCLGGTYVRTLIADLAKEVGSCAHLVSLERTSQGQFSVEDCLRQEDWTADKIMERLGESMRQYKAERQVFPRAASLRSPAPPQWLPPLPEELDTRWRREDESADRSGRGSHRRSYGPRYDRASARDRSNDGDRTQRGRYASTSDTGAATRFDWRRGGESAARPDASRDDFARADAGSSARLNSSTRSAGDGRMPGRHPSGSADDFSSGGARPSPPSARFPVADGIRGAAGQDVRGPPGRNVRDPGADAVQQPVDASDAATTRDGDVGRERSPGEDVAPAS